MDLNGKDDFFARWLHGLCAIPCAALAFFAWHESFGDDDGDNWWIGVLLFSGYMTGRLLWYAVTGRNNISFDVLNNRFEE